MDPHDYLPRPISEADRAEVDSDLASGVRIGDRADIACDLGWMETDFLTEEQAVALGFGPADREGRWPPLVREILPALPWRPFPGDVIAMGTRWPLLVEAIRADPSVVNLIDWDRWDNADRSEMAGWADDMLALIGGRG